METQVLIDAETEGCKQVYHMVDGEIVPYQYAGVAVCRRGSEEARVYQLFEEHCDLYFCKDQKPEEFPFYPVPVFAVFALDSKGNCFGTIGGIGDLEEDYYPVGMVDRHGQAWRLAANLREFLSMAIFYPDWRRCADQGETAPWQEELAEALSLDRNTEALAFLADFLEGKAGFSLYPSKSAVPNACWTTLEQK